MDKKTQQFVELQICCGKVKSYKYHLFVWFLLFVHFFDHLQSRDAYFKAFPGSTRYMEWHSPWGKKRSSPRFTTVSDLGVCVSFHNYAENCMLEAFPDSVTIPDTRWHHAHGMRILMFHVGFLKCSSGSHRIMANSSQEARGLVVGQVFGP